MTLNNLKKRIITSLVLLSIIYIIFNFNFFLAYILIVIGVLSIIEFLQISKKIFTKSVVLFFFNLIFILYIFYFCMTFFLMVSHSGFKIIILMLLIICVASDMGVIFLEKYLRDQN